MMTVAECVFVNEITGSLQKEKSVRVKAMEPPQNISDIRATLEGLESS